jgi:hypothetical protein
VMDDLLVVREHDDTVPARLLGLRPELVFLKGRLILISAEAALELRTITLEGFQPLEIEGRGKWFFRGDVRSLVDATKEVLGNRICLAGRRVIA